MGTGFISVYADMLEKYGDKVTLLTEATATKLVLDNNKVTAVKG